MVAFVNVCHFVVVVGWSILSFQKLPQNLYLFLNLYKTILLLCMCFKFFLNAEDKLFWSLFQNRSTQNCFWGTVDFNSSAETRRGEMPPNLYPARFFQKVNQKQFSKHYLLSANLERIESSKTSFKSFKFPMRCLF